jgi:predicted RNA binding protein YcfA (HicA-like mRNA interferase family)
VKALSGREFARMLESNGWSLQRIKGSHYIYGKAGSPVLISVPIQPMNRSRSDFSAT